MRGKDDCQGRTVVSVSFLQYLGYDAWCAETPFHWYTRVFINSTTHIDLYRGDASEPLCIFNGKSVQFPTPFIDCLYSLLFSRSDYVAGFYSDFINSYPALILFFILLAVSFIVSSLVVLFLKLPYKTTKKQYLALILFGTIIFQISLIAVYLISMFTPVVFIISMLGLLFLYIFLLDRELILKILSKKNRL